MANSFSSDSRLNNPEPSVRIDGSPYYYFNGITRLTDFTIDLTTADTISVAVASGDVYIVRVSFYVSVAGVAPLESVSVQTNMGTPITLLTDVEGAVGNLVLDTNPFPSFLSFMPFRLADTKAIQATITGTAGTGELKMVVEWRPISTNAVLAVPVPT